VHTADKHANVPWLGWVMTTCWSGKTLPPAARHGVPALFPSRAWSLRSARSVLRCWEIVNYRVTPKLLKNHSAELSPSPANEDELETDLGPHLVTEDEQVIALHGFMRDLGLASSSR
jgi:hypothetical protein